MFIGFDELHTISAFVYLPCQYVEILWTVAYASEI